MTMIFFATDADIAQVWRSIFAIKGMKVFEEHSIPDKPNRWFGTWAEVEEFFGSGSISLAAWLEPAGGEPRMERITFNGETQRRMVAMVRTALVSPATIKINRNNEQNGCLASASVSCWREKGARQRSFFAPDFIDQVDWKQLRAAVARIERLIAKASPAKMRSYPVMPDAFERFRSGEINLWNWGEACAYPSPLVVNL
ncbi:hypothetical protein [Novosphingobium sp.]|uniref:hypothetical protein n=1 Tax=Novosphingobium sp. TaxID=1874826 RepID=UPI003B52C3C1